MRGNGENYIITLTSLPCRSSFVFSSVLPFYIRMLAVCPKRFLLHIFSDIQATFFHLPPLNVAPHNVMKRYHERCVWNQICFLVDIQLKIVQVKVKYIGYHEIISPQHDYTHTRSIHAATIGWTDFFSRALPKYLIVDFHALKNLHISLYYSNTVSGSSEW